MTPLEREALIDMVEAENEQADYEWQERYDLLMSLIASDEAGWEDLAIEMADMFS
jgi:hypothetical protein